MYWRQSAEQPVSHAALHRSVTCYQAGEPWMQANRPHHLYRLERSQHWIHACSCRHCCEGHVTPVLLPCLSLTQQKCYVHITDKHHSLQLSMVIISELTWNVSNLKELLCTGITTITFNASVDVCYDGCLQNYTIQIITLLLFFLY